MTPARLAVPLLAALAAVAAPAPADDGLPPGFVVEPFSSGWVQPTGLAFLPDGRMLAWERAGRVWLVGADGTRGAAPLIDIADEVGSWANHGLMSVVPHPDFESTGHVYLFYVADWHHVAHAGTPAYDPEANAYFRATIARITRYTASAEDGFESVDPATRLVLVGGGGDAGFPVLGTIHSTGALAFGADGTLLASFGDSSAGIGDADVAQAIADGFARPAEDVGPFRSQLVGSLCGKIVRLDPLTGHGVPSNPFFDPAAPAAARSRVWTLGLRMPFRLAVRPGTGAHGPALGDPGAIAVGDVGDGSWEELSLVDAPALNLGWPMHEGLSPFATYRKVAAETANEDAPNPLHGIGGCDAPYFSFADLLRPATLEPDPPFPNPCDRAEQVPDEVPHFVHHRPLLDWWHWGDEARVGVFDGNDPAVAVLGEPGAPVAGASFSGRCAVAGVWYDGDSFPAEYHGTFLIADYIEGWIKALEIDADGTLVEVRPLAELGHRIVAMACHPTTGDLYHVDHATGTIHRIRHVGAGDLPPVAVADADVAFGASPLTVQLAGGGSSDPEGLDLTWSWDFGDGSPASDEADPVHVFTAPPGVPTAYTVTLTVTDAGGATDVATLLVSVNNTPPSVAITSPADGATYPVDGDSTWMLAADVADAEHGPGELTCTWRTVLHYNGDVRPEPPDATCGQSSTVLGPYGCGGSVASYRIALTVTDAAGLTTTDEVTLLPACPPNAPPSAVPDEVTLVQGDSIEVAVLANDGDPDGALDFASVLLEAAPATGTATVNGATGAITYAHDGVAPVGDAFAYSVADTSGARSAPAVVSVTVLPPCEGDVNNDLVVSVLDLLEVLIDWGVCPGCDADLTGDGLVDVLDLLGVLSRWGPCP